MKKQIIIAVVISAMLVSSAFAATVGEETRGPKKSYSYRVFTNASTAKNSQTSDVYCVKGWSRLYVTAQGKTALGNQSSLQSTTSRVAVQQGPTASGPWNAFEQNTGIQTIRRDRSTALTKECNYLRFVWTKIRQGVELWLTGEE